MLTRQERYALLMDWLRRGPDERWEIVRYGIPPRFECFTCGIGNPTWYSDGSPKWACEHPAVRLDGRLHG
jgi:hypothetical protein